MRKIYIGCATLVVTVFYQTVAYGLSNWDCPVGLNHEYKNNIFHFEFDSFSWKVNGGYRLCNCVRNILLPGRTAPLFVNWEGADLKGLIKPSDAIFMSDHYKEHKFREVQKKLWFGGAPTDLLVGTLIYDPTIQTLPGAEYDGIQGKFEYDIQNLNPFEGRLGSNSILAKIGMPMQMYQVIGDKEYLYMVENGKVGVVNIIIKFSSEELEDGKFMHTFSYSLNDKVYGDYGLRFEDERFQEAMFGTREVLWISDGDFINYKSRVEYRKSKVNSESNNFHFTAFEYPEGRGSNISTTKLSFFSRSGNVEVASLRVSFRVRKPND